MRIMARRLQKILRSKNDGFLLSLLFLLVPTVAFSQKSSGRIVVDSAFAYQNRLNDSTIALADAIERWRKTAENPSVIKDPDALAIAYGSEGMLEIQNNQPERADSLLRKSLPLFRKRSSKAPVIVMYAEFERSLKNYPASMAAYDEIVHTMDSMPQLWDIQFYRESGYAPYAYAIDAAFGEEQIAEAEPKEKANAVMLLNYTLKKHPNDALGMMALVALHRLGELSNDDYKFKVNNLCANKPELRAVNDTFEKKFAEAK